MSAHVLVSLISAGLSVGLAVFALIRDVRSFVSWTFAVGMAVLALERVLSVLAMEAPAPALLLQWEYYRVAAGTLLPCPWLFFSLSFARENYRDFVARWKWPALIVSLSPLMLLVLFGSALFAKLAYFQAGAEWMLELSWPGYVLYILLLLNIVLILINLERTLRASYGSARWRIKFTLLGIGSVFAVRVYTIAQAVLYSSTANTYAILNASVLMAANLLIIVSFLRDRLRRADIYVSQQVLHGSLTLIIVGVYLMFVGIAAKTAQYFVIGKLLLNNAFIFFVAFLGVAALLLSDDLRHRIRRFTYLHFQRPTYDYRKIWTAFTSRTSSLVDIKDICQAIAKTVSENFGVSAVSIWLSADGQSRPLLVASTALSSSQQLLVNELEKQVSVLMITMRNEKMPLDLHRTQRDSMPLQHHPDAVTRDRDAIHYCAPLIVSGEFLGVMTLNDRASGEPFSYEDFDLLRTICEQAAGILLNHRLFESLARAKEMEAIQTFSAFFVHDLKNVASTLSLTLENLPVHYENPDFRRDAMRVISTSAEKIRTMSSRMSLLKHKLELERRECDLNEVVAVTLASLDGAHGMPLLSNLGAIPKVCVDPEQIQKVLVNLILNAKEASAEGREILVSTGLEGNSVVIAVSDYGCGMSEEFIRKDLFHPFKTTKDRGLGIGLYHCKVIVDAHRGRIEVESRPGEGSTFRVLLPVV
jgi:putative PEP-CTERM system histidine kinase